MRQEFDSLDAIIHTMFGGQMPLHITPKHHCVVEGRMNGKSYWDILDKICCHLPGWWRWNEDGHFSETVIPNIHPTYIQRNSQMVSKKVKQLEWPTQSPDLNPIENLWKELKIRVHRRGPWNLQHLKTVCVEEWAKITPEQCIRLVSPYGRHLEAVITNKGFCTKK